MYRVSCYSGQPEISGAGPPPTLPIGPFKPHIDSRPIFVLRTSRSDRQTISLFVQIPLLLGCSVDRCDVEVGPGLASVIQDVLDGPLEVRVQTCELRAKCKAHSDVKTRTDGSNHSIDSPVHYGSCISVEMLST